MEIEQVEELIFQRPWSDEELKGKKPNYEGEDEPDVNSWPLSDVQKISEFLNKKRLYDGSIASFVSEALSEDHDGSIMFWGSPFRQIFISRCESKEQIKYFYDEIKYGE